MESISTALDIRRIKMGNLTYHFVASKLQKRMYAIEKNNPNFEKSKKWQKYKRLETELYAQLKKEENKENEQQR